MKLVGLILIFLLFAGILPFLLIRRAEKEQKKNLIQDTVGVLLIGAALLLLWFLGMDWMSDVQTMPSVLSVAILGLLTGAGFACKSAISSDTLRRFAKRAAVIAVTLFAAEYLVFNCKSFDTAGVVLHPNYGLAEIENAEVVQNTGDGILFQDDGSVILTVQSPDVRALSLQLAGEDTSIICKAEMMDGNFSKRFIEAGRVNISADGGTAEFSFHTYETLQKVKITLSDLNSAVQITGCEFRSALPLRFSALRFVFLCAIAVLICAVVTFKWYLCTYNSSSRVHSITVCAVIALCTVLPLFVLDTSQPLIDPETASIRYSDPFVQMFDAFQDGRTWIDIEVDPAFEALEDKYDYSVRAENGVSTAWDRAYYNGKYYAYYGAAPVLTFYYPVYWLTGKLPTVNHTSVFFGMLATLCLCGAIYAFARTFLPKVNLISLLCALFGASFCTGSFYLAANSSFYGIPGLAGTAFLMLCVWAGISAYGSDKAAVRYPLFLLSGAALALCAASRPTRAISALLLTPLFLAILLQKKNSLKTKLLSASAFLVPVLAGGIGIMAYNNARFGSPMEFGAVYQITVSDVNANTLHLSSLPYALMQYFFQPFSMSQLFPYLSNTSTSLAGYGQYIYSDRSHGALLYPLLLTGMVVLPFFLYLTRRQPAVKRSLEDRRVCRITYIVMFVIAVLVAWFDFCIAGVIYSYVADILPILTLLAVWMLLDAQERLSEIRGAVGISVSVIAAAAAATALIAFFEVLTLYGNGLYRCMPQFSYAMEDLFCFWN